MQNNIAKNHNKYSLQVYLFEWWRNDFSLEKI